MKLSIFSCVRAFLTEFLIILMHTALKAASPKPKNLKEKNGEINTNAEE